MKILWIVNVVFPEISKKIGIDSNVSGGWMYGLADEISTNTEIELSVATVYCGNKTIYEKIGNITYILIPNRKKNLWSEAYDRSRPDIVHIHGSEYPYALDLMKLRPNAKYILSIQGLIGQCAKNYLAGLTTWDIVKNITFRDIIRNDNLIQARRSFYERSLLEKQYFEKVDAVIGRTEWDKAHSYALNSDIDYFHCDEMLRPEFYNSKKWMLSECESFSIFMSSGSYPLKGLHQAIKALHLLKKEFNSVKLYVSGYKVVGEDNPKSLLKLNGYGLYVKRLIKKLNLENNIVFLGPLDATEIKEQYLKSNVFVCASSVENSPNSLCEAQMLGMPIIASYVGGIPSMIGHHDSSCFYEFDDFVMLSFKIRNIFLSNVTAYDYINYMDRHNPKNIVNKLKSIYYDFYSDYQ